MRRNIKSKKLNSKRFSGGSVSWQQRQQQQQQQQQQHISAVRSVSAGQQRQHLEQQQQQQENHLEMMDILKKIEHNTSNRYKSSKVVPEIPNKSFKSSKPKRSLSSSKLQPKKSKPSSKPKRALSNSSKNSLKNSSKSLTMPIPPYKPFQRRFNVSTIPPFRPKKTEPESESNSEEDLEVEEVVIDGKTYYKTEDGTLYDPDTQELVGKNGKLFK